MEKSINDSINFLDLNMGQNSSSIPASKLFVSDFLGSPQNYCPSEPLLIPLRERL